MKVDDMLSNSNGFVETTSENVENRPVKISPVQNDDIKDVYREDLLRVREEMLQDLKTAIESGLQFECDHPLEDKTYPLKDFIKVAKVEAPHYDFEPILIEVLEKIVGKYENEIQPRTMDLFRRLYEIISEQNIVIDRLKQKLKEVNFDMSTTNVELEQLKEQNRKLKQRMELLEGKGLEDLMNFVVSRFDELIKTVNILAKREMDTLMAQVQNKKEIIDKRMRRVEEAVPVVKPEVFQNQQQVDGGGPRVETYDDVSEESDEGEDDDIEIREFGRE